MSLPGSGDLVHGTVRFTSAKGFGFAVTDADDVHLWLDRGIVPAAGWEARPVMLLQEGSPLIMARYACPAAPPAGTRIVLAVDAKAKKGPTARWWAHENAWQDIERAIEARAAKWPAGAYCHPARPGDHHEEENPVLEPFPSGFPDSPEYWPDGVPARWSVVCVPGELPHADNMEPGYNTSHRKAKSVLCPLDIDKMPVVEGLPEYIRDVLEPWLDGLSAAKKAAMKENRVDDAASLQREIEAARELVARRRGELAGEGPRERHPA